MKRVYAVAESVPDSTPYLTAGKRYEVRDDYGRSFLIIDDEGEQIYCLGRGCRHPERGDWTRIEVDEPDPSEIAAELAEALRGLLDEVEHPTADILDSEAAGKAHAALAKWEASK